MFLPSPSGVLNSHGEFLFHSLPLFASISRCFSIIIIPHLLSISSWPRVSLLLVDEKLTFVTQQAIIQADQPPPEPALPQEVSVPAVFSDRLWLQRREQELHNLAVFPVHASG